MRAAHIVPVARALDEILDVLKDVLLGRARPEALVEGERIRRLAALQAFIFEVLERFRGSTLLFLGVYFPPRTYDLRKRRFYSGYVLPQ